MIPSTLPTSQIVIPGHCLMHHCSGPSTLGEKISLALEEEGIMSEVVKRRRKERLEHSVCRQHSVTPSFLPGPAFGHAISSSRPTRLLEREADFSSLSVPMIFLGRSGDKRRAESTYASALQGGINGRRQDVSVISSSQSATVKQLLVVVAAS